MLMSMASSMTLYLVRARLAMALSIRQPFNALRRVLASKFSSHKNILNSRACTCGAVTVSGS